MIICSVLLLCIVFLCFGRLTRKASTLFNGKDVYLEKNHADIDLNNDNLNDKFNILDSDIDKNDVILTGEGHAIKDNYILELDLLKYMNQKYSVRYLLEELGYSQCCIINQYLESGDDRKLKFIYNELDGTAACSQEGYDFWIELRKYNLTVPENKRIKVIGIDIEHQIATACEYLNYLMPKNNVPQKIQPVLEKYKDSYKLKNNDDFIKAVKNLQSDMNVNSSLYSEYLGNNYFDFSIVVDNIVNSKNAYALNGKNFDEIREPCIYNNFKRIYSHMPAGKYFGEFGMEHVYQKTCNSYMGDEKRFAMYLNGSDSPVKGKVLSIAYGYENCFYTDCMHNYIQSKADSVIGDLNIIDKYGRTDAAVFKLNGDNSPFNKKVYFVQGPHGGCTTDYFQYVILIKNSKGTKKYIMQYTGNK